MAEQSPNEADALMSAYLDEELAPEEAAKVEKLLAESPEAFESGVALKGAIAIVPNTETLTGNKTSLFLYYQLLKPG